MNKIKNESPASYHCEDNATVALALRILESRLLKKEHFFKCPEDTENYLKLNVANLEHEVFACLFLDNQHALIKYECLFRGTIDSASVYPREVVKQALAYNAAAVIFAHNHPSGVAKPSQSDKQITEKLKQALALFDIRVLDHFIIGDGEPYSFAKHGEM